MKSYKRALRRHHRKRLQNKRRNYWHMQSWSDVEQLEKAIKQVIRTPKPCSCFICGNPRKFFQEKTVQERRHLWIELKKT